MKVSKVGGKGNILELEMEGISPGYANALRRSIMEFVPTLAIEIVEFRQNSSILYDEMIAHRLGLCPLTTPIKDYELPKKEEKESNEYHARSSVKCTLAAKGPCTVYAKDLKFKDPKVKPVYPDTPIAKLLEGQEIELEATAVFGQGVDHAKWSPGFAYYHEIPTWKGKSFPVGDERTHVKKSAYKGVDEHSKDFVKTTGHFYFKLEAWGQLSPKDVLAEAVNRYSGVLKEFEDAFKAA